MSSTTRPAPRGPTTGSRGTGRSLPKPLIVATTSEGICSRTESRDNAEALEVTLALALDHDVDRTEEVDELRAARLVGAHA